jgi:hypothetical protein
MEGKDIDWNLEHLLGVVMKSNQVDAIVALDDYDVEQLILERTCELMVWDYGTLLQG